MASTQPVGSKVTTTAGTTTYGAVNANGTQYQSFTPAKSSSVPVTTTTPTPTPTTVTPASTSGVTAGSSGTPPVTTTNPVLTPEQTSAGAVGMKDGTVKYPVYDANGNVTSYSSTPSTPPKVNTGGVAGGVAGPSSTTGLTNDDYLKQLQDYENSVSPSEQAQIDAAANTTGDVYDQQIGLEQERERQAVAKQQAIASGQSGVYSSMATGAATNVQNDYDWQISLLQTQKIDAINSARASAQAALRSGKQKDFEDAQSFFQKAQELDNTQKQTQADIASKQAATAAQNFDNIVAQVAPDIQKRLDNGESYESIMADLTAKGYDQTTINSSFATYQQNKKTQDIINADKTVTLLGNTAVGGVIKDGTIPGVKGDITVLGVANGKPTTIDTAQGMMEGNIDPSTGKWVLTPMTNADGSPIDSASYFKDVTSMLLSANGNPNLQAQIINALQKSNPTMFGEPGSAVSSGTNEVTAPDGTIIDLSQYNSNTGYGDSVQTIINNMGQFTSAKQITDYIQKTTPGSKITGDMVIAAANQNNLPWEVEAGVLQKEMGGFDSQNLIDNNNPGGVTWTQQYQDSHPGTSQGSARPANEGGYYVKFPDIQSGLNGVSDSIAASNTLAAENQPVIQKYATGTEPSGADYNKVDQNIGDTPGAVWQDALNYLYKGPTALGGMGLGSATQVKNYREAVRAQGAAIAKKLGVSEYQVQTMYKANSKAVTSIIDRMGKIDTIGNTLTSQFPRLQTLADKVKAEGINITESDIQSGSAAIQRKFGNTDAAAYIELIQTIRGDYAGMQSALVGGRGGQTFLQNSVDAVPLGLTGDQYAQIQKTLSLSVTKATAATQSEAQTLSSGSEGGSIPSVTFQDPKTGQSKTFTNMSIDDYNEALNNGYIQQ